MNAISRPRRVLVSTLAATFLAGCSVHPIPEDVVRTPTHEVVAAIRCEMRLGFFKQVGRILNENGFPRIDYRDLVNKQTRNRMLSEEILQASPQGLNVSNTLKNYGRSAIAYDFDFEITEKNGLSSDLAFQLPFTAPKIFDLKAAGSLDKIRVGKRTFRSQQTFKDLLENRDWCDKYFGPRLKELPRPKNLIYPISGSIGMDKVVETFMRLSEQGGGKENFVDLLTFTTTISGSLNPSIKLNAVPDSFRLVSGNIDLSGSRRDVHKVKVSLAFPAPKKKKNKKAAPTLYPDSIGDVRIRSPIWRTRYNICVADAREREDQFKVLRDSPPEIYCMEYANAFVELTPSTTADEVADDSISRYAPTKRRRNVRRRQGDRQRAPAAGRRLLPSWW